MAKLTLDTVTEKEWHARKKDAGIASSGMFAKAEQKNNIGPAITAYRKARSNLERKPDAANIVGAHKALLKFRDAITKLVGGDGVKSNRELSSPKAKALATELEALRDEVVKATKDVEAMMKNFDKIQADDLGKHADKILKMFP